MLDGPDVGHVRRRVIIFTLISIQKPHRTPILARPNIRPVHPVAHGGDQQSRDSARQPGVPDGRDAAADHAGPVQGRAALRQGRGARECGRPQCPDRAEYLGRVYAAESRRGRGFEDGADVWRVCEGRGQEEYYDDVDVHLGWAIKEAIMRLYVVGDIEVLG